MLRTTFVGIMATASVLSPRRCRCWAEEMCACGFSKALFNMHDNYFICVWRKKNTSPESVQFGARVDQRRLHPCKYPILVRRMLVTGCWQCDVLHWCNNIYALFVGTAPPLSSFRCQFAHEQYTTTLDAMRTPSSNTPRRSFGEAVTTRSVASHTYTISITPTYLGNVTTNFITSSNSTANDLPPPLSPPPSNRRHFFADSPFTL